MTGLAIAGGVALLFLWLLRQAMPSPRDRQLERLRRAARARGLMVALRPESPAHTGDQVRPGGTQRQEKLHRPFYGLPLSPVAGAPRPKWRADWRADDEVRMAPLPPGWILRPGTLVLTDSVLEALSALLAQAPPGVQGVVAEGAQLGAFWTERGKRPRLRRWPCGLRPCAPFIGSRRPEVRRPIPPFDPGTASLLLLKKGAGLLDSPAAPVLPIDCSAFLKLEAPWLNP